MTNVGRDAYRFGLGGVLTAWVQRPSRRAVNATASKDEATGEAAVITAIAAGAILGTPVSPRRPRSPASRLRRPTTSR